VIEWVCAYTLLAALLPSCGPGDAVYGYVEGEYVAMAPLEVARIASVSVRLGDRVAVGTPIAEMERSDAEIAVADASARLAQAESQLADLRRGRRPEEIEVLAATRQSAEAQAADAERVLARRRDLFGRGFAAQADLDQARTTRDVTIAQVRQAEANLSVARLPARDDAIRAAEGAVAQARAAVDNARWRLSERSLKAGTAGRITDLVRRPGEVAGPQAPVATLLPDGAVKLKLWVPEVWFSHFRLGEEITVRCDGCAAGLSARITWVAPEPEFTPPVIYSVETRQKLVQLVEARPLDPGSRLQPGQIVDVPVPGSAK
jgi:HlyD family secretion protein